MANNLVEVRREDLPILRNMYKSKGSKGYIAYMTLGNYISWFEQDPNVRHIKVFCLNGDFADGAFVVTDRNRAFADTLDESAYRLFQLLQLIDYPTGYRFLGIRPEIYLILKAALQNVNIAIASDNHAILYFLPKEEAKKFIVQPPEGVRLGPITELRDIEKASEMWSHQDDCSFPYVGRLVKFNPNVAAFKADETLVSWILRLPIGLVGGLETDKQHFGHGYGSTVTKALSKKIAEMGDDIYAAVYDDNIPSHSLFKKLGFKRVGEVFFVSTKITWSLTDE